MYGQNRIHDAAQALRAWSTNQIARMAPSAYLRMTRQTGRGRRELETPQSVAEYFVRCFGEYFETLEILPQDIDDYLRGKAVLEYGPGDFPGVALLMLAHGAERVVCVDRFPMLSLSGDQDRSALLEALLGMLPAERRALADPERIEYRVRPNGLSGLRGEIDLVISRAVLEHVNDPNATFADMESALVPGGVAIHQVDLKSHGMHRHNPLDFLTWPPTLWRIMHSHKGVPNRWRVTQYREVLRHSGLSVKRLTATGSAASTDVATVRPYLAAPFRDVPDDELAWLGFWLVCRK